MKNIKNKGFSKIMNKLIYEDIKAEALRELIKNATNEANAYKNRRNLSIIETLFRACIRNIPKEETEIYNALSNLIYTEEEEKISKLVFNELQLNNPKNINIKNIITKFAEICANKYKLNKNRVIELFNETDIDLNKLNFITDSSKKTFDLKNILKHIDASNITDDDIKTFTHETFKEYNKKMRSQFNYAIFMNNGHIKFVGTFDDFGKILNRRILIFISALLGAIKGVIVILIMFIGIVIFNMTIGRNFPINIFTNINHFYAFIKFTLCSENVLI